MSPPKALPDPDVVDGVIVKTEKNVKPSDDEYEIGHGDEIVHIDGWYEYDE